MRTTVTLEEVFRAVKKDQPDEIGDEFLTREELATATTHVLRVLSRTEISPAQAACLARHALEDAGAGPEGMSFGQFKRAVLAPAECDLKETCLQRWLLVSVMPLFYGLATRIGFVTLPMHAVATGMSLYEIGLLLGLFQIMRALSNWVIVRRGTSVTLWLVFVALCGFAFCALRPNAKLACWVYCLTGLGEIIVSLQHDMMLLPGMAENPGSLKRQFSWVCLGAAIAFVPGSWLYTEFGFHASCLFGAVASFLQLVLGGILYRCSGRPGSFSPWIHFPPDAFALRPFAVGVSSLLSLSLVAALPDDEMPSSQAALLDKVASLLDPCIGRVALDKAVMECCVSTVMAVDTEKLIDADNEEDLEAGCLQERFRRISCHYQQWCGGHMGDYSRGPCQAPWVVNALLLSQMVIALNIGTFLGTGGLYYARMFGATAFSFGVSMGFGELLGMCISHLLPKAERAEVASCSSNKGLPWPRIIIIILVMFATSAVVALFSAVPGVSLAILCQLAFQVLNDVWTYLVNEVIYQVTPPPQYRRLQGHGQMYRRVGNAVAGIAGPLLLSIWSPLPFLVVSAMLAFWTVLLAVVVIFHRNELPQAMPAGLHRVPSSPAILAAIHMFNALKGGKKETRKGMGESSARLLGASSRLAAFRESVISFSAPELRLGDLCIFSGPLCTCNADAGSCVHKM